MKCHGASAVFIALLLSTGLEVRAEDRTIYGADDRLEFYEVPENFRTAAAATVSLWKKPKLEQDPVSGKYNLLTVNFGDSYYLCPEVRFREQPIGAFCSGELVGEDLVLTAGHCIITQSDCDATAVVFGYAINAPGKNARTQMDVGDIYSCSGIIKRKQQDTTVTTDNNPQLIYGPDYALIRLDRKVAGRKPVPVNRLGGLKKGDKVFAVGHPVGLPFKFTANGLVVKEVQPDAAYFVTNLDSFGGNSGAAVFNAVTGLIEGIVVRGEGESFIPSFDGCSVYSVRPQNAGYGTAVNKLDLVLDAIPLLRPVEAAGGGMPADPAAPGPDEFSARRAVDFYF